jgi:hypothetical protein
MMVEASLALAIAVPSVRVPSIAIDTRPAYKQPTPIVSEAAAPVRPAAGALSRVEVRALLERACGLYGIEGAEREWLIDKGLAIAWREIRYRPGVVNASGHAGLFQFSAAWGTLAERCDPWWSCRRFVKAYADGGRSALARHWAATY